MDTPTNILQKSLMECIYKLGLIIKVVSFLVDKDTKQKCIKGG
jgi:hypothetical protein